MAVAAPSLTPQNSPTTQKHTPGHPLGHHPASPFLWLDTEPPNKTLPSTCLPIALRRPPQQTDSKTLQRPLDPNPWKPGRFTLIAQKPKTLLTLRPRQFLQKPDHFSYPALISTPRPIFDLARPPAIFAKKNRNPQRQPRWTLDTTSVLSLTKHKQKTNTEHQTHSSNINRKTNKKKQN